MLPWWSENYGNPHSSHALGKQASDAIDSSIAEIASMLHVDPASVVITSGATESNNLAIRGVCTHPRQKRRHIVTVTTEHPAVLDVVADLQSDGFRITRVPVVQAPAQDAGVVDLDRLADAVDDDTALVSVMWANNEIGAIAPMKQIADICHRHGALLHSDATQAVGRIPVDVGQCDIDLLSATAHKFYGPKGTGLLVAGNPNRRVRLRPQVIGGGQQRGIRSGTMNPAGVIGMTMALRLCVESMENEIPRVRGLRDRLWSRLSQAIDGLEVNGPSLSGDQRLPGNLNFVLPDIEGGAWVSAASEIAFSSGSACSEAEAAPSPVLTALGRSESMARRSVRFGVGRFNTAEQIESASEILLDAYGRIAAMAK
jgi:cysteine desulfurase